ncbi:uncharacterized protein LAESUDRAFT_649754 [Laetiporus sulphureus 93-53]|uniref:GIY-YIG domain-containing protein n=1 Tax=Laetiporus sulphureus 93-53 TaxID=1314785 RepID=A0A165F0E1_9APHY|nr:uncharacterized protein LAESUDRAFT_649754 [Laetiporus sulphureus 93-53]KZT08098.1 hypothetical protein LAESUDRAFT_649754 [Laetiporus sulphureus 93-53]
MSTKGQASHRFPAFYACYLLKGAKSAVTSDVTCTTYVGSTVNPLRRIRQHNGEITCGAARTRRGRPWVMQMLVHGFPSRIAALQFEWAWQHPWRSRHLRGEHGQRIFPKKKQLSADQKIIIVREMLGFHPYNTWPLHVKLFTEDAITAWLNAWDEAHTFELPAGFTCSIEVKGVDRKPRVRGSSDAGSLDISDAQFTSSHLRKMSDTYASNKTPKCSICDGVIDISHASVQDPLAVALCPTETCTGISHLTCLADDFLHSEEASSSQFIPRGGQCRPCRTYILWGDVIRGCHRRKGEVAPIPDSDLSGNEDDLMAEMSANSADAAPLPAAPGRKGKATKTTIRRSQAPRETARVDPSAGEHSNDDCVSSSTGESSKKSAGCSVSNPRKQAVSSKKRTTAGKTKAKDRGRLTEDRASDASIDAVKVFNRKLEHK